MTGPQDRRVYGTPIAIGASLGLKPVFSLAGVSGFRAVMRLENC